MKPQSFNDIKGHDSYKELFAAHVANNTCPNFILASGAEGIGKTAFFRLLAIDLIYGQSSSSEKMKAINEVVNKNVSNESIKLYEMNVEGGKATAKEVVAELKTVGMTPYHKKVIICDECHRMSKEAQDVFLLETEYLNKDVYLIFLTTDTSMLEPTLISRAVPVHFFPLKEKEMVQVLKNEVMRRNLVLQGGDSTLHLLAQWFDCKPRAALSQLQLFADGSHVSLARLKTCLGMAVTEEILPLLQCLSGSMVDGLVYINDMSVNESIVPMVIEMLKIKLGTPSSKLSGDENRAVRAALVNVDVQCLTRFCYLLCSCPRVSRKSIIYAFITAHPSSSAYKTMSAREVEFQELAQKAENTIQEKKTSRSIVSAPTINDLLSGASVIGG